LGTWLSARNAARAGENPEHVWNLLAWMLILGIIGARLYHVLSSPADGSGWAYYREHPLDAVNFWNGGFRGLGIYGGLAGGILAVVLYTAYHRLSLLRYLDFMAINVLLAQAIGRMGNFVNQELYGPASTAPWAFHINPKFPCMLPNSLPEGVQACGNASLTEASLAWYANNGFHPTFFYEAVWNLAMFVLLTWALRRYGSHLRTGDALWLYFIAYPLGRFWVEIFRPDAWTMGTLATAQWIGLISIFVAGAALLLRHRKWRATEHPNDSLAYYGYPVPPRQSERQPAAS
jgi:phosphatidylglycerol:prolipoprotein diacylglycerol transferase